MIEKDFHIIAETGIHARPATVLVKTASEFKCNVTIKKQGKEANLKSILGTLGLGAGQGSDVTITCDGEDEVLALEKITSTMKAEGLIE